MITKAFEQTHTHTPSKLSHHKTNKTAAHYKFTFLIIILVSFLFDFFFIQICGCHAQFNFISKENPPNQRYK